MEIWAIAEHRDNKIKTITWEVLAAGQKLARELDARLSIVILGKEVKTLAQDLANKKVSDVLVGEHDLLANYSPETYVNVLKAIMQQRKPDYVLIGGSYQGAEFAPRLAASLGRPLVSGCVGYEREGDRVAFIRQIFNAKMNMKVSFRGSPPYFVTFQMGAFPADEVQAGGTATVTNVPVNLSESDVKRKLVEITKATKGDVDLTQADIIVAGGRGIGNKDKLQVIFDLAQALGAAVGASRPVVDSEWLPREYQIGSSGQTVAPKLYIACGISGAIQHLVGMQGSRCVVAINKDQNAPIFKIAHYGIVDDLFKVVPPLTKLIKELKEK